MKTKIKNVRTKLGLALCLGFAVLCTAIFPTALSAKAYSLKSSITNNSFSSASTSSPNFSSGWQVSGSANEDVISKIVSTETVDASSSTYFDFSAASITNPNVPTSATDKNVLMLLFSPAQGSTATNARQGVKTSSTTTLSSNSFYKLSVWVAGTAKFGIGLSSAIDAEHIATATSTWTEHTIFIKTGSIAAATCNIELWLGSRTDDAQKSDGVVFFDEISLTKIDRASFEKYSAEATPGTSLVHSERNEDTTSSTQGSFTTAVDTLNWSFEVADGESANQTVTVVDHTFTITAESSAGAGDGVVWQHPVVNAKNTSKSDDGDKVLTLTSPEFSINQFGIYRVSFFAKSISSTSELEMQIIVDGSANKSQTSNLANTTINSSYNDWTEYVFYVRAGYNSNSKATISIKLGEESECLFDNFSVQKVNYSLFSSGTHKVDLISNTDKGITNGFFTQANDEDLSGQPLVAYSWNTIGNEDKLATMGIVSIQNSASNGLTYSNFASSLNGATNPGHYQVNGQDVVLKTAYAISSATETYAGIESATISITKSKTSYAVLTVYVQTQQDASAAISLYSGTLEIAKFDNIQTSGAWQAVEVYIKPDANMSLTLKLSLGTESQKSDGTVFFSSASCITTTESVYNAAKEANSSYSQFIDNTSFFAHTAIRKDGLYEPLDFKVTTNANDATSIGGVLDLANIDSSSVFETHKSSLKNIEGKAEGEVLALYQEALGASKISHTAGITNTTTGYVKITVSAKLISVQGKVYITLGELGTFELDQQTTSNENGWITCSIVVKTGSNTIGTVSTEFALGNDGTQSKGLALFGEITTKTVTEDDYYNALDNASATVLTKDLSTKEASKTNKSNGLASNPTAIFFIVLSSIILVGVVVFVVVARAVKRLPKRTTVKVPESKIKNKHTGKNKTNGDQGFV